MGQSMCHEALPFYLQSPTFAENSDGGWDLLFLFCFTLMANTPWDPSQAYFHLHETEEEEEVN